jgi:predicted hydrocarbon binding protein
MSIFDKLMLARQLKFTDGRVELFGQPIILSPSDFLAIYISQINEDPILVGKFYNSAKRSVKEGFGINVGKSYGFSFRDYSNWFVDILKLSGWGRVTWQENDKENHKGVISIQGSPIATYLKGKVKFPCDHVMRGFLAGGASSAYKLDIDVVETECEALGAQSCKFMISLSEDITNRFPEFSKLQLGK